LMKSESIERQLPPHGSELPGKGGQIRAIRGFYRILAP